MALTTDRHRQYLFANGKVVFIWDDANRKICLGAWWWKWSDERQWRKIPGTNPANEQPPMIQE